VWAWLSLLYFDQLCPVFVPDFRGRKKVHDDSCYIPSEDWRKYYRHKLLGPYSLYKAHGNFAAALLTNPVHTVGDINETIASRQEFVQNAEMMKVVHRLYYDQNDNSVKRGATSKEGRKGSAHRLWAIKEQLDLTYDLFSMTCEEILAILPSEFDAWMEKSENK
jgi:hypothetical protein